MFVVRSGVPSRAHVLDTRTLRGPSSGWMRCAWSRLHRDHSCAAFGCQLTEPFPNEVRLVST
eukprot:4076646-Pyramimonas_sp.AAC.2